MAVRIEATFTKNDAALDRNTEAFGRMMNALEVAEDKKKQGTVPYSYS